MVAITHIGLAVSDLDKAISWYEDVLDFELIAGPYTMKAKPGEKGALGQDLFGDEVTHKRNAHLSAINGVGIELFEFKHPKTEGTPPPPWTPGFFHICVIHKNVDELADKIVKTGGERVSNTWQLQENKPYYTVYCKDPFGNMIEIYSRSTEQIYANKEE
ncbi:VOC family protein [Priestia endophytica]|jgi:catechol 2,3-dioxygenase-like lactoylglutathione lyase family enzyme|uniref:VOC family protein n=1 Tax=Priestia endophytica TaxID=135735 RepID=UPI003D2DD2D7